MKTRKQKAADFYIANSSSELSPTNQSLNSTPFVSYKSSQIRLINQERVAKRREVSKEIESTALFLTGFNQPEDDFSPSSLRNKKLLSQSRSVQFVSSASNGRKKPQVIPLTQEEQRNHDRDSSEQGRTKVSPSPNKSVSWGEIARGVIGPLTPKYSMMRHHIKSSKVSESFSGVVASQQPQEPQQAQKSTVPAMPSLMTNRVVKKQQDKRVQFECKKMPTLRVEEERQKRLRKYDDMISSLNKLKETANESAQILSSIRARYEKKTERKVEERNKFVPRVIMGHEGPICPLDRAILIKSELITWRKQRAAKKLQQIKASRVNPLVRRMKHASVSIKRLHSPNLEPLSLKSRNKAHHRTAASLPSTLNERTTFRAKQKGRQTATSLSADISKHRTGKREDRKKTRIHRVIRSSKIKSDTLSFSESKTKRVTHPNSAQFQSTPGGTSSPNAVPPTRQNLKQFTGLQSKSRRLLGIYQHSVIQMMKKTEPKPLRARFTSLKSLEGRDFTYNLGHLRHHLDFTEYPGTRERKMNQSYSFHSPKHVVKASKKTLKYGPLIIKAQGWHWERISPQGRHARESLREAIFALLRFFLSKKSPRASARRACLSFAYEEAYYATQVTRRHTASAIGPQQYVIRNMSNGICQTEYVKRNMQYAIRNTQYIINRFLPVQDSYIYDIIAKASD